MQVQFGAGTVIGVRTDVANSTPAFFGVLQDIEIDFDQSLTELVGQYKLAVDIAPGKLKVSGKAKFAQIQASTLGNLMFGVTPVPSSGFQMAVAEAGTVTTHAVTVTHSATFVQDLGVYNAVTGAQYTPVASAPALGQYTVSAGVYTFNASDTIATAKIYYTYTVTTLNQMSMSQQLMGVGPTFSLFLSNQYVNNAGQNNTLNLKLNACRSSKLTLPFKNTDYSISEFDFQAFADQAGNWGSIITTE